MTNLLILLTIHFVADFVLQTNWQAQNKSRHWEALTEHVFVYAVCFLPWAMWSMPLINAVFFVALTFILHFAVDACTSRINAKLWGAGRIHGFFVGVGADQLIHAYCLAGAWWVLWR